MEKQHKKRRKLRVLKRNVYDIPENHTVLDNHTDNHTQLDIPNFNENHTLLDMDEAMKESIFREILKDYDVENPTNFDIPPEILKNFKLKEHFTDGGYYIAISGIDKDIHNHTIEYKFNSN